MRKVVMVLLTVLFLCSCQEETVAPIKEVKEAPIITVDSLDQINCCSTPPKCCS